VKVILSYLHTLRHRIILYTFFGEKSISYVLKIQCVGVNFFEGCIIFLHYGMKRCMCAEGYDLVVIYVELG
jgi:hypothetical protein